MPSATPVLQTSLSGFNLLRRGKVRDVYELDSEHLLFVATDRLSAFDVVLPTPIRRKGEVLTALSAFWFNHLSSVVKNHLVTTRIEDMPQMVQTYADELRGRTMLVRRAAVFPVECVVRGYLAGSGWKDYQRTGKICGNGIPAGMIESSRLEHPIFTPATKAEHGHDENINFDEMVGIIGAQSANALRETSLELYQNASDYAASRGIILADTKFEFGLDEHGAILLVDEALTPDSSRFWPADQYVPGGPQPSYDKQFVRDYLEGINWNKLPPAPALPDEIAEATSVRYQEAFKSLTGRDL